MINILEKTKKEFFKMVEDFGSDPYDLFSHIPEAEKWANYMIGKYSQIDGEVLLLSVWLHDIGHYPIPTKIDHAIRSEKRAKDFLEKENYPKDKLTRVLHCVRSHRCRDVMPSSFEAKVMAFVDSASHMTTSMYFSMAKDDKENNRKLEVFEKMKRDMRDLSAFPEIQEDLNDLFDGWNKLLRAFEKIDFK